MSIAFKDRDNKKREGHIVHQYTAFEGGMRYVLVDDSTGHEYRCVKKNGEFVELVM